MLKIALQRTTPLEVVALDMVHVEVPTLEGLSIDVEPVVDLDEDTLLELWASFVRDESPRKAVAEVSDGALVRVGVIGYDADKQLVPFTANRGLVLQAGADCEIPEIGRALVGKQVGHRFIAEDVTLPDEYADAGLAGATLDFAIEIEAAVVIEPVNPGDPEVLTQIGLDPDEVTFEALLQHIGEGWMEAQLESLGVEAEDRALDEWLKRAEFSPVPQQIVEHEVWERWRRDEGATLAHFGASEAELARSWAAWSSNAQLYSQAWRTAYLTLLFRAFAEENDLVPSDDDGLETFALLADEIGLDGSDFANALKERPELARHAIHVGFVKRVRAAVLSQIPRNDPNLEYIEE